MDASAPPTIAGDPPIRSAAHGWRWPLLVAAVLAVSVCHYATPPAHANWHIVYQRLYYLPILLGAFWYGTRGGLLIATVASILYLPHIVLHWGHEPLYRSNQLAEILLFLIIGFVAGKLIDRIRREQDEHRRTADELARAYRQLQDTFERLRLVDRLSALGALSAGMAHEIKNPLGSIMGSLEILESAVPAGDERAEFVPILKREVQRLSRIVSTHLDLVRSGRPERGSHDLGEIVGSVVGLTRGEAGKHGVRLTVQVPPDLPTAWVDAQQVRQAVLNLVINAIQAVRDGGQVALAVERDNQRLRIVVEDDGPGLSQETLRRAFEPFYTTKEGGTGLGLSIAFQIANHHGGDLRVANRPGGGARVELELPQERRAVPAGQREA